MSEKYIPEMPRRSEYVSEAFILDALVTRTLNEKVEDPYIIGFDGLPASGKSTFAEHYARALRKRIADEGKDLKVAVVHGDDYMHKRSIRTGIGDSGMRHYLWTADEDALEANVLKPIREQGALKGEFDVYDINNDKSAETGEDPIPKRVEYDIDENTIVVVEGIYLYKQSLRRYFDMKVFFDVTEDTAISRAVSRNETRTDKPRKKIEDLISDVRNRFVAGYKKYDVEPDDLPRGYADVVVGSIDDPEDRENRNTYRIEAWKER